MATFEQFRSTFPEDSNEKGKAFEVFLAEWMFKNHPSLASQFKKVWRFSDWPKAWSHQDLGTDLIAEDQHGKICAIQAKFYKETSSIPKSHIDSFLSDSNRPEVDYRLLIATTDGLGSNAIKTIQGQEKEVQSFLLHNFLEPFDWPESLDSLETYKPRKPHKPRPHQQAAIDDVCKHIDGRGQLLMACGTGKTLTGQRISEKFKSECTLVLLPSLLLLSKTVADWVSESEVDFIYLPVCSDGSATKKTDEAALANSDLCFRATTDANEIAQFLQRHERKVIFSTYQSSPQIAEAFKQHSLKPFDLIIADEAHRCAGKVSSDYSTVLAEDLIPANNRLFMTATPRMYTSRIKKKLKDAEIEIASMDDESVFGPVLHNLTFGQAIANDPPLLTDYRVLVVGVNDETCKQMVEERAFIKTESGLEDDAQSIAIQLGLSKAVKDYDLKRVISFHSRVNYAKNFANSFQELQQDLKPQHKPEGRISYSHVSGAMPTSERTKELRALGALENEDRYIVGNARCLSEGVDVPSLDGVAFVDPRRSEIDIIQAVGRAIRLSEGKETGTIVIPVFISDEDDPDEVLSSSQFDQVWKVVNALRSHDESLGEMLDQFRVRLGRKQKVSFKDTKIVVDGPEDISETFIEAFETKLVETTTDPWEFWYGLLVNYKEAHGDLLVPQKYKSDEYRLGGWVAQQRLLKEQMPDFRAKKLNSLGFIWDAISYEFEVMFSCLSDYKKDHGDCLVPRGFKVNGHDLGQWVNNLRARKDQLSDEKIKRLDALEFIWEVNEFLWLRGFEELSAYKEEYGNCLVKEGFEIDGFKLAGWVARQRQNKESLPEEKVDRLNELGFIWDVNDFSWEEGFRFLSSFKEAYGNCLVKKGFEIDGFKLASWVDRQRQNIESLAEEKVDRLNELGFIWDVNDFSWEEGIRLLSEYKNTHGDCLVRGNYQVDGFRLADWVKTQRVKKETLAPERIQRLDDLGFVWDPFNLQWEESFKALVAYHAEFGDCLVPDKLIYKDTGLGTWVSRQRTRKQALSGEKIQRLDDLGFVWDARTQKWEKNFQALVTYKAEFGDCQVAKGLTYKGLKLGTWVSKQRANKEILTPERMQRLDDLGLVWDPHTEAWEQNFQALVTYKAEFGDCLVASVSTYKGLKLGTWVSVQRKNKETLSKERRERLDDLGFVWKVR